GKGKGGACPVVATPESPFARGPCPGLRQRPGGIRAFRHRHASFPIWPLEESREDGRVVTSSLVFVMGGRSTQPDPLASGGGRLWASAPVRCLSPHSAGHTSHSASGTYLMPGSRDARCSVCLRRRADRSSGR